MKRTAVFIISLVLCTSSFVFSGGQKDDSANNYPNRPITLIIPYATGGTADTFGRIFADFLGRELGTSFVVVNRPGANAEIGTMELAMAKPDGYTLGILNNPDFIISDLINDDFEFDTLSSVTYITAFTESISTYYVKKDNPKATAWDQFIAYCKANPGRFLMSCGGIMHRFLAVSIMDYFGIEFTVVGYDGLPDAQAAFLGNHVDALSYSANRLNSFLSQGAIPLWWGGAEPCPYDPSIKMLKDTGLLLDYLNVKTTLCAPAGLPQEILDTLNNACKKISQDPALQKKVTDLDYEYVPIFMEDVGKQYADYYNQAQAISLKYKDALTGYTQ